MIMFVGQVARDMREREAFQELDYRAVFGSMAKWATEIDDPARIPEIVSRAFLHGDQRPARAGGDRAAGGHADRARRGRRRAAVRAGRDLAGPDRHGAAAEAAVGRGAADHAARRQPLVAGRRRAAIGALRRALRAAGRDHVPARPSVRCAASLLRRRSRHRPQSESCSRASRRPTWSCWSAAAWAKCRRRATRCSTFPDPQMTFVHVHPGAEELGRVYRPHLAIHAAPTAFAAALEGLQPPSSAWRDQTEAAHADYLAWTEKADSGAGRRQSRRDHGVAARKSSRRRHHLQRRRQFLRLDSPLLPLPPLRHPYRADLRLDGLWRAGGGGDEAAASRAHRGVRSPATAIS